MSRSLFKSPLFGLRPNYGGGNEDDGNLLQKVLCVHCRTECPRPCSRPLLTHTSAGESRTLWVSLLWGPCSFLLGSDAHKVLFVPSKSLFPQSCVSSVFKSHLPPKSNFLEGGSQSLCQIPRLGNLL